jgi:hypothetical protein
VPGHLLYMKNGNLGLKLLSEPHTQLSMRAHRKRRDRFPWDDRVTARHANVAVPSVP